MIRNVDLARDIMLAIERSADDEPASIKLDRKSYSEHVLSHHVRLLHEAGLIHAIEKSHHDGANWTPHSLTWDGYEFLSLIRDDATWQRLKQAAGLYQGDASFAVLKDVALRLAQERARANAR